MLRQVRSHVASTPRALRIFFVVFVSVIVSLLGTLEYTELPQEYFEQHAYKQNGGAYRIPKGKPPSVHLVVAATAEEDYSWVHQLKVPGLTVVPYIADNMSAPHHPRENKGHEAGIYLQYFLDFYEDLPDVSILIHSHQAAWHVDSLLEQSMEFSLNHLDMREVQRRGFTNLRVTWGLGCEDNGINTTRANIENVWRPEEPVLQESFRANFNIYDIPEILASPCCSQIAVTKELVQKVPKDQFEHHIHWLLKTDLEDGVSGRVWEHMWHYLFLQKAIECPLEYSAYCMLYHICFSSRADYDEFVELHQGREKLQHELEELDKSIEKAERRRDKQKEKDGDDDDEEKRKAREEKYKEVMRTTRVTRKWLEDELWPVQEAIRVRREVAIVRGSVEANRVRVGEGEPVYDDGELVKSLPVPSIV